MKKLLFAMIINLILIVTAYAEFGMSSFPVLMIDSYSARPLSMGNTGVVMRGSADTIFANPAGLASLDRISLFASRVEWMFDTSFNTITYAMPIPKSEQNRAGVLALSGVIFDSDDFSPVVDGVTIGDYKAGDFSIGLVYANNLFKPFNLALADKVHLEMGFGVKYVQARLGDYSASDLAFDAGMDYSLVVPNISDALGFGLESTNGAKPDSFTVAFAFRNLAVNIKPFYDGGVVYSPWYFDFGIAYAPILDVRHKFWITTAIQKPSDGGIQFMAGAEYSYKDTIYLRAGYKFVGRDTDGLTLGVGLNFEIADWLAIQADYSMVNLDYQGVSDVFSIAINI